VLLRKKTIGGRGAREIILEAWRSKTRCESAKRGALETPTRSSASAPGDGGDGVLRRVQGIDEPLKGLVELFGAESIQSFPAGLDAEADARAKPHFEAALKVFQAARKTRKETCSSFWSMILARDQGLRGPVR
jgi:hypothetical protein